MINYTPEQPAHTAMKKERTPPPTHKQAPQSQPDNDDISDEDDDDYEEGVYENEPQRREDVMREEDKKQDENLPAAGTASSLRAQFLAKQQESLSPTPPRPKREVTPPNPTMGGGEYVSEPRVQIDQYEGKAESGVFESEPVYQEDVVRSSTYQEESVPERGTAKNLAARFKQIEEEGKMAATSARSREITPDKNTLGEYVTEPREVVETYQGRAESGVFENQPATNPDVVRSGEGYVAPVPEKGTARNLAQRYHQISEESKVPQVSRSKKELTPDTSGRVEYVSEPTGGIEQYEAKTESGVFENQPLEEEGVVKSDQQVSQANRKIGRQIDWKIDGQADRWIKR